MYIIVFFKICKIYFISYDKLKVGEFSGFEYLIKVNN